MTMVGPYGGYGSTYGHGSTYGADAGFPALGFNPAPGEIGSVDALATQLRGLSERLAEAGRTLTQLAQPGSAWEGQAASAFSGTVSELPGLLQTAHQSLGDAGASLERWSGELPRMQQQAQMYERQAQAAQQRVQSAENDPAFDERGGFLFGEAPTPEEQQAIQQAQHQLEAARSELAQVKASAEELRGLHQQTAQQIERAVRSATELAPTQSILESIGGAINAVEDWVSGKLEAAWDWTQVHAEEIAWVGDILSTVSGALGIAAIVLAATGIGAPLALVLGGAALATGAAALAAHGTAKAAGANVGWTTIAMDSVGVVLGGAGKVAARGIKAAQAARNTFKANREWAAARQVLQGPMRRARTVKAYSKLGSDAVGVGGVAYSGTTNQYREVWDSNQWMGGKYKSTDTSARPPRQEVAATFCRAAQGAAG